MKIFLSLLAILLVGWGVASLAMKPSTSSKSQLSIKPSDQADLSTSPDVTEATSSPVNQLTSQPITQPDQENKKMIATLSTTLGDIKVELFTKDAPKTVENFKQLAAKDYYKGVAFHRVIKDFMIQGGDPTGTGAGGESAYGKPFEDEINSHKMAEGVLAMANAGPGTNGSQFFIVTTKRDLSYLDGHHTVFGQVTEGLDVAYKIAEAKVDGSDKPVEPIKINSVKIDEQ